MNTVAKNPDRIGELISNRYRIDSLIGTGAWNQVYLAHDEKRRNQAFAIKILKPNALGDEDNVSRFQSEVQFTQQLEHPNIVKVFSSGFTQDGSVYLACEYCDGGDLEQYISSIRGGKGVPFYRAINLLRFIARGLAHAHNRKVVHRDIKPENILLTSALGVKIADFGIARSLRFESSQTGSEVIGTPSYMAPEQFDGSEIGPWSDIYSLGILTYELLRGQLPFEADSSSRLMYQHCNAPTPELTFKDSGIPCWMEEIVHKACEKEPASRYQNGTELSEAIESRFQQELSAKGAIGKVVYYFRPNGRLCTILTEKGVSRKKTRKFITAFILSLMGIILLLSALRMSM